MTLLNASKVFTMNLILTLVDTILVQNAMEVARPITCKIRQFHENGIVTTTEAVIGQCIQVVNVNIPTSLQINCNDSPSSSYKLYGFSSATCGDMDSIFRKRLPSSRSLGTSEACQVINKRKPICSFRLHDAPFPEYPVTVTFHGTQTTHHFKLNDRRCIPISCGVSANIFPKFAASVELHDEVDGLPMMVTNSVELFSDNSCQRIMKNDSGDSKVESGTDLVNFTRRGGNRLIAKAFRIIH